MLIRQQRIEQNKKAAKEKSLQINDKNHKRKPQNYLIKKDDGLVKYQQNQKKVKEKPQATKDPEERNMDELYTFDNEYEYLLYELKKKEEDITTESTDQPQPLFKITIPLNEEGKM